MRILIDARMMGAGNTRGIGRYIEEIVRAMIEIKPDDEYVLLERDPSISPFANHPSVEHIEADIPWYGLAEQLKLPKIITSAKPDIYFAPHWNIPYFLPTTRQPDNPTPLVIFIHDLILLEEPSSANISTRGPFIRWIKRLGHRIILKRALSKAKVILVPTHHVGNRIKFYYPEINTKIIVTGEGMPRGRALGTGHWASETPDSRLPTPDYLLMVGSAYPHKNHATVLKAWDEISRYHPSLHLKIVGTKDAFMQRIMDQANRMKLSNIEFLGQLPDEELDRVYDGALALIFPSRWEGFGLPPLEAISHGIPVLSSNTSCMPEVLGDRGVIYFNPDAPNAIVEAVENLLRDPGGVREEAKQAIAILQQRHDWNVAAVRTLRAIEEAIH